MDQTNYCASPITVFEVAIPSRLTFSFTPRPTRKAALQTQQSNTTQHHLVSQSFKMAPLPTTTTNTSTSQISVETVRPPHLSPSHSIPPKLPLPTSLFLSTQLTPLLSLIGPPPRPHRRPPPRNPRQSNRSHGRRAPLLHSHLLGLHSLLFLL